MKALICHGPGKITCESVPDPKLFDENSAIVQTTLCAICGSDLHPYHVDLGRPAYSIGHEAVGEVVEVGRGVTNFAVGDRVLLPATLSCGQCRPCREGNVVLCETNKTLRAFGQGANGIGGCQAQAVAAPLADLSLFHLPDNLSDEVGLMLTDTLGTAWMAARRARVGPGDTVAVIGLGAVGLQAIMCAMAMGAARVIGIDLLANRRQLATELGAETVEDPDVIAGVAALTGDRGVHVVIDANGGPITTGLAVDLIGKGGRVSVVGISELFTIPFPIKTGLHKNLEFYTGICSAQLEVPHLLRELEKGQIEHQGVGEPIHASHGPVGRIACLSILQSEAGQRVENRLGPFSLDRRRFTPGRHTGLAKSAHSRAFRHTMRLKERVAVITGSGSGIGKAIADRFASEGAFIIVADKNESAIGPAVQDIKAAGGGAAGIRVDVTQRDQVQECMRRIVEDHKRIDILVNNAGLTGYHPFLTAGDEDWDVVLNVVLKGSFYCAQAVAPYMIRQQYGKLVNISSSLGTGASPHHAAGSPGGSSAYASAKAGVIQLTKTLARELGPNEININSVAPGFFLTPLTGATRTPEQVADHVAVRSQMAVLNRPGRLDELAKAVLFLASDESSFIAGHTLCVDGGRTDRM